MPHLRFPYVMWWRWALYANIEGSGNELMRLTENWNSSLRDYILLCIIITATPLGTHSTAYGMISDATGQRGCESIKI